MKYVPIQRVPRGKEEKKVADRQRRGMTTLQHGVPTKKTLTKKAGGEGSKLADERPKGATAHAKAAKRRMGEISRARKKDAPSPKRSRGGGGMGGLGEVSTKISRNIFGGLRDKKLK